MSRKPYKRGPKSKTLSQEEKKKRGISNNQVSVICDTDRMGNVISELICNGRICYMDVERFLVFHYSNKGL